MFVYTIQIENILFHIHKIAFCFYTEKKNLIMLNNMVYNVIYIQLLLFYLYVHCLKF